MLASNPSWLYRNHPTLRPSDRAWLALLVGVAVYEVLSRDGELLSEAADRYRQAHPWLVRGAVIIVAVHLLRAVPDRYDVMRQGWMLTVVRTRIRVHRLETPYERCSRQRCRPIRRSRNPSPT